MFNYSDIKYFRVHDIDVYEIDGNEKSLITTIPPLDVFKQVKIIEISQGLNPSDMYGENEEKKDRIKESVKIATGKIFSSQKHNVLIFFYIILHVIKPVVDFLQDENFIEFLKTQKGLLEKTSKIEVKEKDSTNLSNFPFMSLISKVMQTQTIPDSYAKYLGLPYFLWASRFNRIIENYDTLKFVSLLEETARLTGYLCNPPTEGSGKNIKVKKVDDFFERITKPILKELNVNIAENKNKSAFEIIKEIEESSDYEDISNLDYYEKYIKPKGD